MPRKSLSQNSFFDPEFVMPTCLREGTVPWLLARFRSTLFPAWLLAGWRGEGKIGRNAWPAVVLITLWLLRWTEEGTSRVASVRRARTDAAWRAAMGLSFDVEPPSEKTMRDFEKFLAGRHAHADQARYIVFFEHVVRQCLHAGVIADKPLWATDSTPMWCYGAVLDTVRLMGDGLRDLGRCWAKATRTSLADVAECWDLPLLLAKSVKGSYDVDWRDAEARADVVDDLADNVVRIVSRIRADIEQARSGLRKPLLRRCRRLLQVVCDNLEADEQGRLVIARKVAAERLVSLTDPQARHGRKSKSRRFNGFKLHVLGDLVSGLIAAVCVTAGNLHDSVPTHRLARRAKGLVVDIEQLLADTAYGGTVHRNKVGATLGIDLLTPPPPDTQPKEGKLGKSDFAIDFAAGTATCPAGKTTSESSVVSYGDDGTSTRKYKWSKEDCRACPLRQACVGKARGGRRLLLHPLEEELREHRQRWEDPEVRKQYRRRGEFERLINQPVRHGGRRVRAWGLTAANLQAHAIAAVCNLGLLARALANAMNEQPTAAAA